MVADIGCAFNPLNVTHGELLTDSLCRGYAVLGTTTTPI